MSRWSRRVATNPHQRRQARWLETLGCGWASRRVSAPADSSPSAPSSSRMRSRVGSPRARKYLATRSVRAGAAGRRNGDGWATAPPFQNFVISVGTEAIGPSRPEPVDTHADDDGATLSGHQGRLRLPPQAARIEGPPRTRPCRWVDRSKRTARRGRTTPPTWTNSPGHRAQGTHPAVYPLP